jgi:hypothetical protein
LIVPWVRTMDTAEPLTSMETGSGLLPEELGICLLIERSRYNRFVNYL